MPVMIALDVDAPAGSSWPTVPAIPSTVPLSGLVSYVSVNGAELDTSDRVARLPVWAGTDLVNPSAGASAPSITDWGGNDAFVCAVSRNDRLIFGAAPAGVALPETSAAGMSVFFPVHLTAEGGLCSFFGFQLRAPSGLGDLQCHKPTSPYSYLGSGFSMTGARVIGLTYDVATETVKLYGDGAQIATQTNASWGGLSSAVACVGSAFNPGTPCSGKFGDLLRYNRALTAPEAAAVSDYLAARYGIS